MYPRSHLIILFFLIFHVHQCYSATCDVDHPCPPGLECRFVSYLPGTKACVYKSAFTSGTPAKRNGRCPTTGLTQWLNPMATPCNSNQDCPINRKCCPLSYGGMAYCVDAVPISSQPAVTQVVVGDYKQIGDGFDFTSTVTLVQSNGVNVLVDTGAVRMTEELLNNLWSKAGLTAEDIDVIVTTHGHPDHYGSLETFSNIPQVFSEFIANGKIFTATALRRKEQYFLNNDRNIEILQTPGHTLQDLSVIVRNVPNFGTMVIVGDLMLFKNDGSDSFAQNKEWSESNRKKVTCMADYIVPGHGPIYQVDSEQKSKFNCSTG